MGEGDISQIASIVGIVLTVLAILIVVLSFLMGLKRGMKKTLFRLAWVFVFTLIIWFVTPAVSNLLNNIDLTSLNLDVMGPVHRLSDIGTNLLNQLVTSIQDPELANIISTSPALNSFMQNLPTLILNVVIFVLLFFIVKWILWPIWALISAKIFDKDKKAQKQYKKRLKELKKKGMPINSEDMKDVPPVKKGRYAFVGGIFGLVMGLLTCAVLFSPFVGLSNIYQTVYTEVKTTNEQGQEVPFISTLEGYEDINTVALSYENSASSKILRYTGMEFMANVMFSNMATVNVNDDKVKLTDEVTSLVGAYNEVVKISEATSDMENITKEQLNDAITSVKEIFFDVENSKLVYLIGNDILPQVVDYYLIESEDFKIEFNGVDYSNIIRDAYRESTKNNPLTLDVLQPQVNAVADIVLLLNNSNIMVPLIRGEIQDESQALNLLSKNIANPTDFSDSLVNSLYDVTLLESQFAKIFDELVKNLYQTFEITSYESNLENMNSSNLSNNLKVVVSNAITFIKYFNNRDGYDFGDENTTRLALESLGKTIDGVKTAFLSQSSYNGLVDFIKGEVNNFVSEFGDLSQVVNSLDDVSSWEEELRAVSPMYNAIVDIQKDPSFSYDAILNGSYDLSTLGTALESVVDSQHSAFVTNQNLRTIFDVFIDKIDSDGSLADYINMEVKISDTSQKTLKEIMLDNIWDGSKSSIEDWGKELNYSIRLLVNINRTIIDFNKEDLLNSTKLETLGQSINDAIANTKLIVSKPVLRAVFENFIDIISTGDNAVLGLSDILNTTYTTQNQSTYTVKEGMLNNIYNISAPAYSKDINWQTELGLLKNLLNLEISGEISRGDYVNIGKVLDLIKNSQTLTRPIVSEVVIDYIEEETNGLPSDLQPSVSNIINTIRFDAENDKQISFEQEFTYLLDLMDTINGEYNDNEHSAEYNKLNALGASFNQITGFTTGKSSKLLTKSIISDFIEFYLQEAVTDFVGDEGIKTIIIDIANENNLNSITNYQLEFTSLMSFVDMLNTSEQVELKEIGIALDDYKKDSVILNKAIKDLLKHFIDKNIEQNNYTDWLFNEGVIEQIKANVNSINVDNTNFEREFEYLDEFRQIMNSDIVIGEGNTLGALLDKMVGNNIAFDSSKVMTKEIVNTITTHTFDTKMQTFTGDNSLYKDVFADIRNNISSVTSYANLFTDFGSLNNYVSTLTSIQNFTALKEANQTTNLGQMLDNIAKMEVCGGVVSWKIANIFFNELKEFESGLLSNSIDEILTQNNFDAYSDGSAPENYYQTVVDSIVALIN